MVSPFKVFVEREENSFEILTTAKSVSPLVQPRNSLAAGQNHLVLRFFSDMYYVDFSDTPSDI